jgi:hypothetical protein
MPFFTRLKIVLPLWRRWFFAVTLSSVATSLTLGGRSSAKPVLGCLLVACTVPAVACSWVRFRACREISTPRRHGLLRIELIAFNVALSFVLAEIALRSFAILRGASPLINDSMSAYRLRAGGDYGNGIKGNSLGYPGTEFQHEKVPGRLRVAALGDSFAVGPAVPYADNYLKLLERELQDVEIYNFGVSGTGPREYLAILCEDVWQFRPDFVLVSVFVGNDITEIMATPRHLDPRQCCTYLLATRAWKILQDRWRQSTTVSAIMREQNPGLAPATFREVEARRLAVCLRTPSLALEKKWQRALGYLEQIAGECRARDVPLGFVLIPDEFQVNPSVLSAAIKDAGISTAALDLCLPQERLVKFCTDREISCLDLLPIFRGVPETYAPNDTHWNVSGNRLATSCVARWLAGDDASADLRRPLFHGLSPTRGTFTLASGRRQPVP